MLPRSDCLNTVEDTLGFLTRASKEMLAKSIGPDAFCFLIHHYIPSRSSAFCLAYPSDPKVRIDSIWGLPDGLLFYPHDSFELNPDNSDRLKKRIRFKDTYLAHSSDGKWIPVRAGRPWDWSMSVNIEELIRMGKDSQQLAKYVGDCVQVMWFIDAPVESGFPHMMPWWYRRGNPPSDATEADPRVFNRRRIVITDQSDLDGLVVDDKKSQVMVLRLIPKPELLRDGDFLARVADKAKKHHLTVELQGSILQHAYYRLRQLDVSVQCVDFSLPVPRPQRFRKLVRDLIPVRIRRAGERVSTVSVSPEDMIKLLKVKAVEEALELCQAAKPEDVKEELSDILEVILSVANRMGLSSDQLNDSAERKRVERGGFQKGIVLLETQEVPLIDIHKRKQGIPKTLPLPIEDSIGVVTTRRTPLLHGNTIVLPLVPPEVRVAEVRLHDLSISLRIEYEDKDILLKWEHALTRVPPEQMKFPNFP